MRNLDTDLLRSFVTVAEASSFTKASQTLLRSQAAVSMQVKRLEELLGNSVFVRGRQGLSLTSEGEFLMHYARRILHLNDEVLATIGGPKVKSVVRIGAPDDYASVLLPRIFLQFRKLHPNVQIDLSCDSSVNLVRQADSGQIDLALITRPLEGSDGHFIRTEPLEWVASNDFRLHQSTPVPLALFPPGCPCRELALATLRKTRRPWQVAFTSSTISATLAVVASGLAITAIEACLVPPTLRRLSEAEGLPSIGTVDIALYKAPQLASKPAAALGEYISLGLARVAATSTNVPSQIAAATVFHNPSSRDRMRDSVITV